MSEQKASKEPVLKALGVKKYLGEGAGRIMAVKGVDIDLRPGELTLLMGPSGSGKTTLLSILGCILSPTEGEITLAGHDLYGLAAESLARIRRDHIGFVFQQYNLFPTLTALENVMLSMDVRGVSKPEAKRLAEEALTTVGLADKFNNYPKQLSGGEQQRTAVARALVGSPTIILADEPTAALDSKNGQAVMQLLSEIAENNQSAILAVTHDPRTEPYAHRIIRIEDGLIVADEKHEPAYKSGGGAPSKPAPSPHTNGHANGSGEKPHAANGNRQGSEDLTPVVSAGDTVALAMTNMQYSSDKDDNHNYQNSAPLNPARGKRSRRPVRQQKR